VAKKVARAHETIGIEKTYFPDKLEVLKSENINIKTQTNKLEDNVKRVETQLRRKIDGLRADKILGSGSRSGATAGLEHDLDKLIGENVALQMEEQRMLENVRKLQNQKKNAKFRGKSLNTVAYEFEQNGGKRPPQHNG